MIRCGSAASWTLLFSTVVLLSFATSGCERPEPDRGTSATASAVPTGRCEGREVVSLVPGPRVLRGTVKVCAGDRLTIAYGHPLKSKPRPEREVESATTWDVGAPASATKSDLGLCHYGRDLWKLCRVEAAESGRFRVATPEGQVREIETTDMVVLDGAPKKTVHDHFANRAAQRAFDEAVLAATFRPGPAKLKKGQTVVAPRVGTTFYEGTILSLSDESARIGWTNDAWPEREVAKRQVGHIVRPKATLERAPQTLQPDQLVLWRMRGSDERFEPVRVVSAGETYELRDHDGETRSLDPAKLELVVAIADEP